MKYTLFLFFINSLVYSHKQYINISTDKKNISTDKKNITHTSSITNMTTNMTTPHSQSTLPTPITIITPPTSNIILPNSSKATFYFRVGDDQPGCPTVQTFNDGNKYGPCNQGVQYNSNSKYWCAIKNAQSSCGKKIRVNYNNRSIELTIMDECPGCDNNVDMSLDALIELTGSKEAACAINLPLPNIQWHII